MSRITTILITIMAGILFCLNVCAWADDVEDEIKTGLSAYKAKEYTKAISSLEFAAQQIRQLKAGEIETLFPAPLSGWIAQQAKSTAVGAVLMGGVISGSKKYTKGDSEVEINIVTDSPMISAVSAMLSNPIMMTMATGMAGGTKITKVKGKKAIAEWDAQQKHGSIKMVVVDRALITITGSNCQEFDIQAYAGAIDYNKIQSFVSE